MLKSSNHTKEKRKRNSWTAEEDALLLEKFEQGLNRKQVTDLLPGRTYSGVNTRLLRMMRSAAHSHEELLNGSSRRKLKYTDVFIGRFMDLRQQESLRAQQSWTAEETKHLLELQRRGTMVDDVFLQFPSRSHNAVHSKITREHLQFPGRNPRKRLIVPFKPFESSAASEKDESRLGEQG